MEEMDDENYSLSPEGARMMATILFDARDMGLYDNSLLTEENMMKYVMTLASVDSLWEQYSVDDPEERTVMLVIALMSILQAKTKLN
jgi:hypothetical protein